MGSHVHWVCFLAAITHAQPQGGGGGGASPGGGGGSSSSSCATDGTSAAYEETIGTTGGVATRTIVTTTCPNHEAMCTGKDGVSGCGAIGANGDSTEASVQDVTKVVPASPVLKTRYTADDTKCEMGEIAYALNGVSIFSGAVEQVHHLLVVNLQITHSNQKLSIAPVSSYRIKHIAHCERYHP